MTRHLRAAFAAIVTTLLVASTAPALAQGGDSAALTASPWTLTSMGGQAIPADAGITATFADDGTLTGSGGCNDYSSTYALDGDSITIEIPNSTRMACGDEIDGREIAYLNALPSATAWAIDGGQLTLSTRDGSTLVYGGAASSGSIVGSWTLETISGAAVPSSIVATADFSPDGQVSGSGGCNSYNAEYTVDGSDLSVTKLNSTRMACDATTDDLENTFLGALQVPGTWAVSGSELTITSGNGIQLGFGPGSGPGPLPTGAPPASQEPSGSPVVSAEGIVGPTWFLSDIMGQDLKQLRSLLKVTLTLGTDGIASGSGGCNDYTADYTLEGEALSITNLDYGTDACDIAGFEGIEGGFFQLLPLMDTASLEGGRLVLTSSLAPTVIVNFDLE